MMQIRRKCGPLRLSTATALFAATGILSACQTGMVGGASASRVADYPFEIAHRCNPEVVSQLDGVGIEPSDITKIWYDEQRGRDFEGGSRVVGYAVWARVADGPGYLVVDVNSRCFVRQIYTRGGLELPGITAY